MQRIGSNRITSQRTKFANVMQQLPSNMMDEISDVFADLPEYDLYNHLKEVILKCTGHSEEDMIQETLENVTRGAVVYITLSCSVIILITLLGVMVNKVPDLLDELFNLHKDCLKNFFLGYR